MTPKKFDLSNPKPYKITFEQKTQTPKGQRAITIAIVTIAVATVLNIAVSGLFWYTTNKSVNINRNAVKVASDQTELFKKDLSLTHRPFLGMAKKPTAKKKGDKVIGEFYVHNYGRTPASKVTINLECPNGNIPPLEYQTIFPNQTESKSFTFPYQHKTLDNIQLKFNIEYYGVDSSDKKSLEVHYYFSPTLKDFATVSIGWD